MAASRRTQSVTSASDRSPALPSSIATFGAAATALQRHAALNSPTPAALVQCRYHRRRHIGGGTAHRRRHSSVSAADRSGVSTIIVIGPSFAMST